MLKLLILNKMFLMLKLNLKLLQKNISMKNIIKYFIVFQIGPFIIIKIKTKSL